MDCLKCPIYLTHNSVCGPVPRYLEYTNRRKSGDCARLEYSIPLDVISLADENPHYGNLAEWMVENTKGDWATTREISPNGISAHLQTFMRFELKEDATLFKLTFL